MKPFDQSYFFRLIAPVIFRILPVHPSRRFWCRFILSALLVQLINIVCAFWEGFLDNPTDATPQYVALVAVETVRYGGWLWGFWYSFYQLVNLFPHRSVLSPQLLSCTVTGGLWLYLLTAVTQHVEADYLFLVRGMLICAFIVGVVLPTIWQPVSAK